VTGLRDFGGVVLVSFEAALLSEELFGLLDKRSVSLKWFCWGDFVVLVSVKAAWKILT